MGQRLVPLPEQLFGELKPLRADIVMRRSADRGLERAGKMEAAQACDRSQAGECQITFQIGSDVIEHTRQSALIKSCLSCTAEASRASVPTWFWTSLAARLDASVSMSMLPTDVSR